MESIVGTPVQAAGSQAVIQQGASDDRLPSGAKVGVKT